MSPTEALAATLISKMREKFGEAAKDIAAQEIISDCVRQFIMRAGSMQEEDIASLSEHIRLRLSGRTPPRNTLAMQRRAKLQGDEWARIWTYEAARVGRELARDRDIDVEKKARQRRLLDGQVQEKHEAEQRERQKDVEYGRLVSQDVLQWEQEELARHAQLQQHVDNVRQLQEEQIADKAERVRQAKERVAQDDAAAAGKLAYETKTELEREAAHKAAAKQALIDFLKGNEANKAVRERQLVEQREEDVRYMKLYEEMLERQQNERLSRLEKLKEWQDKSENRAASMPESKRWIDPAIIQKNWEESEAARDAEERRRQAAVVEGNRRTISALNRQVAEKAAAEAQHRAAEAEHSQAYLKAAEAESQREREERRTRLKLRIQAKLDLEAQLRDNARRRVEAPMSEVEKTINKPLLALIDRYERSSELELKPYPAEFLPRDLQARQKALNDLHAKANLKTALV